MRFARILSEIDNSPVNFDAGGVGEGNSSLSKESKVIVASLWASVWGVRNEGANLIRGDFRGLGNSRFSDSSFPFNRKLGYSDPPDLLKMVSPCLWKSWKIFKNRFVEKLIVVL